MSKKQFSLADLDATKAASSAFEFEYIDQNGENSGIFFSVLGGESEAVSTEVARMSNERRRKEAARQAKARYGKNNSEIVFEPFESDIEFGQRLAAVRLVGWRGITDTFTPEAALKLCKSNQHIAAQIVEQSNELGNFMKL